MSHVGQITRYIEMLQAVESMCSLSDNDYKLYLQRKVSLISDRDRRDVIYAHAHDFGNIIERLQDTAKFPSWAPQTKDAKLSEHATKWELHLCKEKQDLSQLQKVVNSMKVKFQKALDTVCASKYKEDYYSSYSDYSTSDTENSSDEESQQNDHNNKMTPYG